LGYFIVIRVTLAISIFMVIRISPVFRVLRIITVISVILMLLGVGSLCFSFNFTLYFMSSSTSIFFE
jgi:hypothetical protein